MVHTELITAGKQMAMSRTGFWGSVWEVTPKRLLGKTGEPSFWSVGHAHLSCREERDQRALECQRTLARGPVSQGQWAQREPQGTERFYFCTILCPRSFHVQGHSMSSPPKPTCSHTCSQYNILEATTPPGNDPGNDPISPSPAPAEPRR